MKKIKSSKKYKSKLFELYYKNIIEASFFTCKLRYMSVYSLHNIDIAF